MSTTLPANEKPTNQSAPLSGRVMTKPPSMKASRSGPLADRIFAWAAKGAAVFTLIVLIAILVSLTISAWPAIAKFGFGFLTSSDWDPVNDNGIRATEVLPNCSQCLLTVEELLTTKRGATW